jgi:hypothetical protein
MAVGSGRGKGEVDLDILERAVGRVSDLETAGIHIKIACRILYKPTGIEIVYRDIRIPGRRNAPGKKKHYYEENFRPAHAFHMFRIFC